MLTSFDKYNAEIERFRNSKYYQNFYNNIINVIRYEGKFYAPISSKEIERRFEIPGTAVRACVSYARSEDCMPIGSNNDGYFWAIDYFEAQDTVAHLEERATKIIRAADGIKKYFKKDNEQLNLFQ